mgnify:CR=1 FL=1
MNTPKTLVKNHDTLRRQFPTLVKFALFDDAGSKWRLKWNLAFPERALLENNQDDK